MNTKRKAKKAQKIGYYYLYKNDFSKALKSLLRAISFKNMYPYFREDNYLEIASCYKNLGDLKNAEKYIKICLEQSGGFIDAKEFYGNLLCDIGKEEEGKKLLSEVQQIYQKLSETELDLEAFYNSK